jgi:hypothetical protein
MNTIEHRGFLLTRHTKRKIWYLTAKPFYYHDFPNDLTARTQDELMKLVDDTLIRLKYLLEGQ